jgi:hypothetical protein
MRWKSAVGMAVFVLVGLVALVSIPPAGVALDDQCRPQGLQAWISANVSAEEFWSAQVVALSHERERLKVIVGAGNHLGQSESGKQNADRLAVLQRCGTMIVPSAPQASLTLPSG